ncbi:Ets domain [Trinorchestia longiramus]|nr:Ets domain [Trinorchestia longiramus]
MQQFQQLSGGDTPTRGLALPTPLFSDLLHSPFSSLVGPNTAPEPSSATPAVSPKDDLEEHSVKRETESSPSSKLGALEHFSRAPAPRQEKREDYNTDLREAVPAGSEYKVRWGEHAQRICEHIAESYGDTRTSDVALVGRDGASVTVHSFVMACASPLLRRVLQDVKADQPAVVVVPGASAAALEAIVSVCYRGTACLDKALAPQVLKIAQALEITQLCFDDTMASSSGPTHLYSKSSGNSPPPAKMKMPLPILPKPSYTSPSPPAVFTFTPPIPQHSPPPYSTALASSILARTPGKRRPLTPDLSHTESAGVKSLSQSASPSSLPASPFSGVSHGGPSSARDNKLVPDIVGMGGTSSRVLLWKFLLHLLHDNRFCPVYIRWLDRSNGVFRIMESDMVAKLWGLARKNSNMNYEKMSRGMRTYYKRGILYHIDGTKLIYKFNTSDSEVQQHMKYFEMTQQPEDAGSDNSMSAPGLSSGDSFLTGSCSDSGETTLVPLSLENSTENKSKFEKNSETSAFAQPSSLLLTEDNKPTRSILGASLRHGSSSSRSSGRSTPLTPRPFIPPFPGMPPLTTYSALPNLTMNAMKRSQQYQLNTTSPKTSRLPNSLKSSVKRLEQFGLNKLRSNSIPNFQSSGRFSSFFHSQDPRTTEVTQSNSRNSDMQCSDVHCNDVLCSNMHCNDVHSQNPQRSEDLQSDDDSRDHEISSSHPVYVTSDSGALCRSITNDT